MDVSRTMIRSKVRAAVALLAVALAALAVCGEFAAASGGRAPKVVQVSYGISYGDSDAGAPTKSLEAFVRDADKVRFSTSFGDESARAPGRYKDSITDTNLHGPQSHPWVPARGEKDGHKVVALVQRQLEASGVARVKIRAKGPGGETTTTVDIVDSDCAHDPPIYPIDCEVRP